MRMGAILRKARRFIGLKERVLVIFDGAYLSTIEHRVNIRKIDALLSFWSGGHPYKKMWYTSIIRSAPNPSFFEVLERSGISVVKYGMKQKTIKCDSCAEPMTKWTQKGVDIGIALKAVEEMHLGRLDTLVLFAGDGDFAEMVELLRSNEINVIVVSLQGSASYSLIDAATKHFYIDEYLGVCKLNYETNAEEQTARTFWSHIEKAVHHTCGTPALAAEQ